MVAEKQKCRIVGFPVVFAENRKLERDAKMSDSQCGFAPFADDGQNNKGNPQISAVDNKKMSDCHCNFAHQMVECEYHNVFLNISDTKCRIPIVKPHETHQQMTHQ